MHTLYSPIRLSMLALSIAISAGGCAATGPHETVVKPHQDSAKERISEAEAYFQEQIQSAPAIQSNTEIINGFYADSIPRERNTGDWLSQIPFSLEMDGSSSPISLREILRAFSSQGVNITTDIPISGYYYTGLNISNSNAKHALDLILANLGVDYVINDEQRSIRVTAMPRKSYYLSLNNRRANYSSGGTGDLRDAAEQGMGDSDDAPAYEAEGSMRIETSNNFWESLDREMSSRCTLSSNSPSKPPSFDMAGMGPDEQLVNGLQNNAYLYADDRSGSDSDEEIRICDFTINENTGTVTVQGPSWIQKDMATYFERMNTMLNSRITLEAKIVLFSTSAEASRGVDLSAFAGELGKTGVAIQNNVLGGLTLNTDGHRASVMANSAPGNSYLGVQIDGAQAFLGWLESQGQVSIENEPVITTVSGVPTTFRRTTPIVYFRYDQRTTPNEGGTVSVSIETTEVERSVGSIININPTYDIDRDLVRTQLGINQRYLTGWKNDQSYLAAGESIEAIPIEVPLIEEIVLNGELLLTSGETIIVGGQKFTTSNQSESGITNLREQKAVGGLFGASNSENQVFTYYMILSVNVDDSPNDLTTRL